MRGRLPQPGGPAQKKELDLGHVLHELVCIFGVPTADQPANDQLRSETRQARHVQKKKFKLTHYPKFSKFGRAQATMGALWPLSGRGQAFFGEHGRDGQTGRMSIISTCRATAGVRLSIGLEAGPLFGLNAVRAVRGSGGCAVACAGHGRARSGASAPCLSARLGGGRADKGPAIPSTVAELQALALARRARSSSSTRMCMSSCRIWARARVTSPGSQVVIARARACVVG